MIFDKDDFEFIQNIIGISSTLYAKMIAANNTAAGVHSVGARLIAIESKVKAREDDHAAEVKRLRESARAIRKVKITLLSSNNTYLRYPCVGLLDIWELGTDGSIITKVFHRQEPDGRYGPPVEVQDAVFIVGKVGV